MKKITILFFSAFLILGANTNTSFAKSEQQVPQGDNDSKKSDRIGSHVKYRTTLDAKQLDLTQLSKNRNAILTGFDKATLEKIKSSKSSYKNGNSDQDSKQSDSEKNGKQRDGKQQSDSEKNGKQRDGKQQGDGEKNRKHGYKNGNGNGDNSGKRGRGRKWGGRGGGTFTLALDASNDPATTAKSSAELAQAYNTLSNENNNANLQFYITPTDPKIDIKLQAVKELNIKSEHGYKIEIKNGKLTPDQLNLLKKIGTAETNSNSKVYFNFFTDQKGAAITNVINEITKALTQYYLPATVAKNANIEKMVGLTITSALSKEDAESLKSSAQNFKFISSTSTQSQDLFKNPSRNGAK